MLNNLFYLKKKVFLIYFFGASPALQMTCILNLRQFTCYSEQTALLNDIIEVAQRVKVKK